MPRERNAHSRKDELTAAAVAYNARQTHGWVNSLEGDLPVTCPKRYRPRLPGSFTIPAHTSSDWYIVIAFTIGKPGRYYL